MPGYPHTIEEWFSDVATIVDEDALREAKRGAGHVFYKAQKALGEDMMAYVIALGAALHRNPPSPLPEGTRPLFPDDVPDRSMTELILGPIRRVELDPAQALALAAEMFVHQVVPGPDRYPPETDALVARVHTAVTAVFRDGEPDIEQRALLAMVRQLGGAKRIGMSEWLEAALADRDSSAGRDVMDRVRRACAQARPARAATYVYGLGFITFQPSTPAE